MGRTLRAGENRWASRTPEDVQSPLIGALPMPSVPLRVKLSSVGDELVKYEQSATGVSVTPTFSLNLLSPLGALGNALAEIVAYRLESKRARQRLDELKVQAEIASLIIQRQAQAQMRELEIRQRAVDGALAVAASELVAKAQTTSALIDALRASDAQVNALIGAGSSADRRAAMQMKVEIAHILADFAVASSHGAVEAVRSVEALAGHTSADVLRSIEAMRPRL